VVLKAFDRNRILWFETGPGGAEFNLTAVDVDTGRATRIPNRIPFENRGIGFDSRLRTAYLIDVQELAVKAAAVGRRSIKTLFEVRSPKVDSLGGRTRLLSLFLSPDGKSLFFTEHSEPDNREVTFVLDVVSRRTRVLLTHDQGAANNRALAASPDGRYIWLQADCPNCGGMDPQPPEYTVLDRTTGAVERFLVTAEIRLHFAGWVRT
jgi:hypothetical protein